MSQFKEEISELINVGHLEEAANTLAEYVLSVHPHANILLTRKRTLVEGCRMSVLENLKSGIPSIMEAAVIVGNYVADFPTLGFEEQYQIPITTK